MGTRGCKSRAESLGLAEREQKSRLGIAKDIGLPRGIFADAIGAQRRIDRHGNAARQQDSGKRKKEFGARGQHDRDRLPRLEAAAAQFIGDQRSALVELAERDRAQVIVFFVELDVRAGRFAESAQAQNFGQRFSGADPALEIG